MLFIYADDQMADKFSAEEHDRRTQHDPATCGDCNLVKHELYNGAGCWRQFCTCEFVEDQGDGSITRQPCGRCGSQTVSQPGMAAPNNQERI